MHFKNLLHFAQLKLSSQDMKFYGKYIQKILYKLNTLAIEAKTFAK